MEESWENSPVISNPPTTPATTRPTSSASGPSPLPPSAESSWWYLRSTFPLKTSAGTIWSCGRAVSVAGLWSGLNALAQQGDCEYTCEEMGGGTALMGSLGLSFISWGSNKPLQRSLEVSLLFPQLCPIQWRLMRRARRTSDPSPSPPALRNSGSSSTPTKETVEKASKCLMWRMMVRTELLTFFYRTISVHVE